MVAVSRIQAELAASRRAAERAAMLLDAGPAWEQGRSRLRSAVRTALLALVFLML